MEFILGIIWKSSITITDDTIEMKSTFSGWTHARAALVGYRTDSKRIMLYTIDNIILETIQRDAGSDALLDWLKASYPDLDQVAQAEEMAEILADDSFGQDEQERRLAYSAARRNMYALIIAGVVTLTAHFLVHALEPLLFCIAAVLPIVAAHFYQRHHGLMRILNSPASVYPVLWPAYLICLIYMGASYLSHSYLDTSPLYATMAVVAIVYIAAFFGMARGILRYEYMQSPLVAGMVLYFVLFAFFSVAGGDCAFDTSAPALYHVEVRSTRAYKGSKSTNYYMTVQSWGPFATSSEESISSELYQDLIEGDSVTATLHAGALGAQWYEVGLPVIKAGQPGRLRNE